jgi:Protein of unknown function (DUF4232)
MPALPPAASAATPLARGMRMVPTTVMAVAAAGLLAACASATTSSTASAPHAASSSSRTPNASTSSTAAKNGSGTSGTSGTAGLTACGAASLRVAVDASQAGGAAGSTYVPVTFTNTSSSTCGMYGYPGVSFVTADDSAGHQIGAAAQQNAQFAKQSVRLTAGGVAHAWLQVAQAGNYPPDSCQPVTAHWLRVFAPGQTAAIYVSHSFDACSDSSAPLLTVMPVRAGQGKQGMTP